MAVKIGGVVGLCTESFAARPGIVLGVVGVPGEPEPRLDVIGLVALPPAPGRGTAGVAPCVMLGVPFEDSRAKGTGLWWKYCGPEVLVRGPVVSE